MAPDKSLAAEIEAVTCSLTCAEQYLIEADFGAAAAAVREASRLLEAQASEIAALQSRGFEDGARCAVVPLEPTEAMLNAPLAPGSSITGARYESRRDLRPLIYAAMVAARPSASVESAKDKALRDIAQQDRGGLQGIYEDGGDADAAINYLLGQIDRRRRIARAALQPEGERNDR